MKGGSIFLHPCGIFLRLRLLVIYLRVCGLLLLFKERKCFLKKKKKRQGAHIPRSLPTDRPTAAMVARSGGPFPLFFLLLLFFVTLLLTSVGLSLSPLPPRSSPLCCVSLVNTHLKVSDPRQIVVLVVVVVVFPFILSSSPPPRESTFSLFVYLFILFYFFFK